MGVVSNVVLVLLYVALWLVIKARATFLTNQKTKTNRDLLARVFPRLFLL